MEVNFSSEDSQAASNKDLKKNKTVNFREESEVQQTDRSKDQINTRTLIKQFIKNNSLKELIKNTQVALEKNRLQE